MRWPRRRAIPPPGDPRSAPWGVQPTTWPGPPTTLPGPPAALPGPPTAWTGQPGTREPLGPGEEPGPRGPSRKAVAGLVAVFCGLLLGAAGTLVHLPYAIMMPGPVSNVLGQEKHENGQASDLIVIDGQKTFPTTGALDFTTVRVNGGPGYPVNVWDVLAGWIDPTQDVYPVGALFPPQQTAQDVQAENQAEMVDSQQEAAAVALRKAGFPVPQRIKVGQVAKDAPAGDVLKVGDVITSVGGVTVTDATSVRAAIQRATPGQPVDVVVQRNGAPVTLRPNTGRSPDGRTVLGIVLGVDFSFPFSVKIDVGSVGGPSAGTMFSLGIYDKLTEGSMTGGKNIAGTGTIDSTGKVGPIGGIRQKMAGAKQGGATFFLAPADNCTEVRGHEPNGLQVVRIATFDEAEKAVTSIGQGDTSTLPRC